MTDTSLARVDSHATAALRPGGDNPVQVYLLGLGRGSRRTMQASLNKIVEMISAGQVLDASRFDWSSLEYQHTQAIRTELASTFSPSTANKMLCALRGVLKESWRLGYMDSETYHRAADIKGIPGNSEPAGRSLNQGEIRSLFAACAADSTPAGRRDAALMALLYGAGLRRSEAVKLTTDDYDIESGMLRIRQSKGNKSRTAYATNGAKRALDTWLQLRGDTVGALLCPVNKSGCVAIRHMTEQAVYSILDKRAAQAKVKAFSPHDLRRTFIGDLLDAGADIVTVQQMAGHANVQTTARYDRRPDETRRKAAELLHVPFAG